MRQMHRTYQRQLSEETVAPKGLAVPGRYLWVPTLTCLGRHDEDHGRGYPYLPLCHLNQARLSLRFRQPVDLLLFQH